MADGKDPNATDPNAQQQQQQQAQQAQTDPNGQKPQNQQNGGAEPPVVDSHGQPGINLERHEREMAEKDKQIAELQAQIAEAAKTEETRAALQKQLDEATASLNDMKASLADEKVTHQLEMAGCLNVKMAKAVLGDYSGDIAKVKEACPYLFEDKQKGSTGLQPGGVPGAADERRKAARKAAGLE